MPFRQGADGLQNGLVQFLLWNAGGVGAPSFPVFDPVDTPPHDFFAAVDVPGHPAVRAAAAAAHKAFGKGVLAGEPAFVGFAFGMSRPFALPPGQFLLDLREFLPGEDGGVVVPDVVLGQLPVVLFHFALQEIRRVGLLQEHVPHIFFILQDALDGLGAPGNVPRWGADTQPLQGELDGVQALPVEEILGDEPDDPGFLRDNFRLSIGAFSVA